MGSLTLLLPLLIAACVASGVPDGTAISDKRPDPPAPYPIGVVANAACVLNGHIYVTGGWGHVDEERGTVAHAYRYDPRANAWERLPDMPRARCFHACVAAAGRVWVCGGVDDDGTLAATDAYDPAKRAWTTVAPMPTPRNRLAAETVGERIYTIAGMQSREHLENTAVVEIYDIGTNTWTRGADAPAAGHGHALAVVGTEIICAGGLGDMKSTYIYDPQEDAWRAGADMPQVRLFAAAASDGRNLYVMGNRNRGDIPLLRYELAADRWEVADDASVQTHRTAAAYLDGRIYVIAGEDNFMGGELNRVSRYDIASADWAHSD